MPEKHTPEMYRNHRSRLRAAANKNGIDTLDVYKLIELYLFDLLPRIDTYPASHLLLDRFKTVDGVFSASREELMTVHGIGPKSADHIVATGEIVRRAVLETLAAYPLSSDVAAIPVVSWILHNKATDTTAVVAMEDDYTYVCHKVFSDDESHDGVPSFIKTMAKNGASKFYIAHVHPERCLKPTPEDISSTEYVSRICQGEGASLIEHYIISGGETVCIIKDYLRKAENK